MKQIPYCEAISSLMYASVATRPDITFAVSTLSQFLDNPGSVHWEATKRVIQYLAGTKDINLMYGTECRDLLSFTDADGAMQSHQHAISRYAFLINGGTVSWSLRKQELVMLSTAEAEYVAMTHAAKEGIWLQQIINELFQRPLSEPTTLFCDNQSAIRLAMGDNYHARTKHIDIWFHFIRKMIKDGTFNLIYCPTDEMTADILMKALRPTKSDFHMVGLGLGHT
jgi:hypothetical protein